MAGCFGNYWTDRIMEQQLYQHLIEEDEEDEANEEWERKEADWHEEENEKIGQYWDKQYNEQGDDTDAYGNNFSDADPGL